MRELLRIPNLLKTCCIYIRRSERLRCGNDLHRISRLFGARTFSTSRRLFADKDTDVKVVTVRAKEENVAPFYKRYLFVHTLNDVYEDVKHGAVYDVCYLDSNPDGDFSSSTPTVLALHGSPGSHRDFLTVLTPLVNLGYRVIVPNLPGFGETEGMIHYMDTLYTGANHEKLSFINDFMNYLGITRVDMLVSFGEGCYPAVVFALSSPNVFRSIALICPTGHKLYRGVSPKSVMTTTRVLWDYYPLRPFVFGFWQIRKRWYGWKDKKTVHVIKAAIEASYLQNDNFLGNLVAMKLRSTPLCFIYGEEDKRVEREITEEMIEALGLTAKSSDDISIMASPLSNEWQPNSFPMAVMMKNCGHYVMSDPACATKITLLLGGLLKYSRANSKKR